MMKEESTELPRTPPDLELEAEKATEELLPKKSRAKYEKEFSRFDEWRKEKGVTRVSENVLLAYLSEKSQTMKSSTLWCSYSMLKATLKLREGVDIGSFSKLTCFMKRKSTGFVGKKSKTLSRDDIRKFLNEGPDENFLLAKVVLLFGVAGACRREEICFLSVDDVEDNEKYLTVRIKDTKTNRGRTFTMTNDCNAVDLYRKYLKLRPAQTDHKRLFLCYKNSKCTVQPVGINTIGKFPKIVAEFLGLPNPEVYTGHCFRRSSATLLADTGADLLTLKRHGGWKSGSVAEGYIDESIGNKLRTARKILGDGGLHTTSVTTMTSQGSASEIDMQAVMGRAISFHSVQNCSFNINIQIDKNNTM